MNDKGKLSSGRPGSGSKGGPGENFPRFIDSPHPERRRNRALTAGGGRQVIGLRRHSAMETTIQRPPATDIEPRKVYSAMTGTWNVLTGFAAAHALASPSKPGGNTDKKHKKTNLGVKVK